MPRDPLETALSDEITKRVASGEWTVIALAGEESLRPIAEFLDEQFGVELLKGAVIAVIRCKDSDAG